MNKYISKICPYCKAELLDGEDIVVCSACEMPHHKECWIDNKGCTTFGCQGTIQGITFEVDNSISSAPKYDVRDSYNNAVDLFCTKCGAKIESGSSFCTKCGAPLGATNMKYGSSTSNLVSDVTSKISSEIKDVMKDFKTNDYFDPEIKNYIGTKQEYYLMEFSKLKNLKQYYSWNWMAFLFGPLWCLYRKMYLQGGIILGLDFILSLIGGKFSILLQLIISIVVGVFANYFYMYDVELRINKGKQFPEPIKAQYIAKVGGTTYLIPILSAVFYTLIYIIFTIK